MPRSKPKAKYQGFALAVPLIKEIKKHIKNDNQYRSVTDFVRQAVRNQMDTEKRIRNPEYAKQAFERDKKIIIEDWEKEHPGVPCPYYTGNLKLSDFENKKHKSKKLSTNITEEKLKSIIKETVKETLKNEGLIKNNNSNGVRI